MTQDPNIGRTLEGKYKLLRVLGTGGMGTVYEATHLLIKRRLAVKLLHAEYAREALFATRFKREAQTASAIGHDHIVDITDMGTTEDGELFIVMEYLEGADLATMLQKEPFMSPHKACHIMIQVLSALEAAHAMGIVHRDLKPANIFIIKHLDSDCYVKLVDFGISKRHQSDEAITRGLTKTGEILGTPSFMSPEQARGDANIDNKSDIFSAGVILYALLTGNVPFEDKALTMLLLKILNDTPPHPCDVNPNVPKNLGDAVLKSMEKDPAKRFKDAASFRRVLQRYSPETASQTGLKVTLYNETAPSLQHGEISLSESTPLQLVVSDNTPPKKRKRVIGMVVAALLIALVAAGAIYSRSESGIKAGSKALHTRPVNPPNERRNDTPRPVAAVEKKPPAPKTVEIRVTVSPETADVLIDGNHIGTGAAEHIATEDDKPHELLVSAEGYETYQNSISFDKDIVFDIKLAKELKYTAADDKKREKKKKKDHSAVDHADETTTPPASTEPPPSTAEAADDADPPEEKQDPKTKRPHRAIDEVNPW